MEKNSLSTRLVRSLRDCRKQYVFRDMSLNTGNKRILFLNGLFRVISRCFLDKKTQEETLTEVRNRFSGYDPAWFNFGDAEVRYAREVDLARMERLILYLYQSGLEPVAADYVSEFKKDTVLQGVSFDCVKDYLNLICKKPDGSFVAIRFRTGKPDYSYHARIESKKVENSLELFLFYLGIAARFPSGIRVEEWFLTGKDDKNTHLEDFEYRRGKNIIGADFKGQTEEELDAVYRKLLLIKEPEVCESCRYDKLCKISREIRSDSNKKVRSAGATGRCTKAQEEVIGHIDGPMSVLAVPGAGKTFSLVKRTQNLINEGIDPQEILFVTFTKKACEEIRTRVSAMLLEMGRIADKCPTIVTFNSLGYSILKEFPLPIGKRVKLCSELDRHRLIAEVLSEVPQIKNMSYDGMETEHGTIRNLERLFDEIVEKGEEGFSASFPQVDSDGVFRAHERYQELYNREGYITFDEQVSLVNRLFRKCPAVAKELAKRYRYIMVDEYQDSNAEQVDMLYSIADHHGNIVVVGDDDQSIYGWRGSSNEFIMNFSLHYRDAVEVRMEENFRSNECIVEAADALINNVTERAAKRIIPKSTEIGMKPVYIRSFDVIHIKKLIRSILDKGYNPGDIAVLCRYNKGVNEVAEVLSDEFPVNAGKDYIISDSVFGMIKSVLSLAFDGLDADESLYAYFVYSGMAPDSIEFRKTDKRHSLYENMVRNGYIREIKDKPDDHENGTLLQNAGAVLERLIRTTKTSRNMKEILEKIVVSMTGISGHPLTKAFIELAETRSILDISSLYELMCDMERYSVTERVGYQEVDDAINVMTDHDAKGKEFPVVILINMEDYKEIPEEIRVLYVAITRAKKELYMFESAFNECEVLHHFKDKVELKGGM